MSFEDFVEDVVARNEQLRDEERINAFEESPKGSTDPGCSTVMIGSRDSPTEVREMDK